MAPPDLAPPHTPTSPFEESTRDDYVSNSASETIPKIRSSPRNGIPPKRKAVTNPAHRDSTPTGSRQANSGASRTTSRITDGSTAKRPAPIKTSASSLRPKPTSSSMTREDAAHSPKLNGENEKPSQGSKKRVSIVEPPGSKSPTKKRSIATIDRRSVFGTSTVRDLSSTNIKSKPSTTAGLALRTTGKTARLSPQSSRTSTRTPKPQISSRGSKESAINGANREAGNAPQDLDVSPSDLKNNSPPPQTKPTRPSLPSRKSTQSQTIEQRLREMEVVHQMLRIAMAEEGEENDEEKEEYGRQVDEKLSLLRDRLAEARRQEGKDENIAFDGNGAEGNNTSDESSVKMSELEDRLAASNETKDQLTNSLRELEGKVAELLEERAELGDHVSSLQSDGIAKDNELSASQSRLQKVTTFFSARMKDLNAITSEQYGKFEAVQDRLDRVSTRIDTYGHDLSHRISGLLEEKETEAAHHKRVIEKLQDQIRDLYEKHERDVATMKDDLEAEYQDELNNLHIGHDSDTRKIFKRAEKEAKDAAEKHAQALEDLEKRLSIKRAETSTQSVQTRNPQYHDEAMQTIGDLSEDWVDLHSLKQDHENVMSAATQRMQDLEKQIEFANRNVYESQETIRDLLAGKLEDDEHLEDLRKQFTKLQEEHQSQQELHVQDRKQGAEARDRLIAELEGANQQMKFINDSLATKEAELQTTNNANRELSQKVRTASQASERHRSVTIKTMDELKAVQGEVSKMRQSNNQEIMALKQAIKVCQTSASAVNEQLRKAHMTISQQSERIKGFEKENLRRASEMRPSPRASSATTSVSPTTAARATHGGNATVSRSPVRAGNSNILGDMAAFRTQVDAIQAINDDLENLHRQSLKRLNGVPTTVNLDRYGMPVPRSPLGDMNLNASDGMES